MSKINILSTGPIHSEHYVFEANATRYNIVTTVVNNWVIIADADGRWVARVPIPLHYLVDIIDALVACGLSRMDAEAIARVTSGELE